MVHHQEIALILLEKSKTRRERSSIKDSCAMFSVGKEGRVKLQATAVSKTAGENRGETQVCLDTNKPRSPTKCGVRHGERVS